MVEPDRRGDDRGFFQTIFCQQELSERGVTPTIAQVHNSLSQHRGTLRGMHYQLPPSAQSKLLRCVKGSLWDAILDLRPWSTTYGQSFGVELNAENRLLLFVPKGFAHGFLTLEDATEVIYFVDEFYAPTRERILRWNDPRFGIRWPMEPIVLSDKDRNQGDFDDGWHLDGMNQLAS